MKDLTVLAVVPARGGSKGIPRKNVRFLAGRPLITYAIKNALGSEWIDRVVVSTDDDEIASIADLAGCEALKRPAKFAEDHVPLDPVIEHAVRQMEEREGVLYDLVVTIQATSPLLSSQTIDRAIEKFTLGKADTLLSVVDDRHLTWTKDGERYVPNYQARKNRQFLPPNYRETGGIMVTKREFVTPDSRFGPQIDLLEVDSGESIDIDSEMDWWIAEKLLKRKKIMIRVDGYEEIGLGHIYRTLLLAGRLIDHDLLFVTRDEHALGTEAIAQSFYPQATYSTPAQLDQILDDYRPDMVINDILDTQVDGINQLRDRGIFVVNFEDMGEGAALAHVVINALYEKKFPLDNYHWGQDYYCLRDEFLLCPQKQIREEVENILLTFGGTDPNDYTARVLKLIANSDMDQVKVSIVSGLGYGHMDSLRALADQLSLDVEIFQDIKTISKHMHRADIVFTSAGRTVYEIASIGTPVIVLAQNKREMHHTFARPSNGIINLGIGSQVSDEEIIETLSELASNFELRQKCNKLMLENDLRKGMDNVLGLILQGFENFKERQSP